MSNPPAPEAAPARASAMVLANQAEPALLHRDSGAGTGRGAQRSGHDLVMEGRPVGMSGATALAFVDIRSWKRLA